MSTPSSIPAGSAVGRRCHCPTRSYFSSVPGDLMTWAQASEELSHTPHPMSERDVRRKYHAAGGVVWEVPGRRGELVSYSALIVWHRDYHRGWLAHAA